MTTESEIKLARYQAKEREADELGRVITVRRLRPSEQTKINGMTEELTGSDKVWSKETIDEKTGELKPPEQFNLTHRMPLMIAASVCEIDQVVIPFPRSRAELDAIYDRLDMEGLTAAGKALSRLVLNDVKVAPLDEAKNLSGTPPPA